MTGIVAYTKNVTKGGSIFDCNQNFINKELPYCHNHFYVQKNQILSLQLPRFKQESNCSIFKRHVTSFSMI